MCCDAFVDLALERVDGLAEFFFLRAGKAVSYTHLDVYKRQQERIRKGLKGAVLVSVVFCVIVSALVFVFAKPLMLLFVEAGETEIIAEGVRYLHIEGAFYCGIGCLFLLYGLYRAVAKPGMSVVLTVISLGTRVVLRCV